MDPRIYPDQTRQQFGFNQQPLQVHQQRITNYNPYDLKPPCSIQQPRETLGGTANMQSQIQNIQQHVVIPNPPTIRILSKDTYVISHQNMFSPGPQNPMNHPQAKFQNPPIPIYQKSPQILQNPGMAIYQNIQQIKIESPEYSPQIPHVQSFQNPSQDEIMPVKMEVRPQWNNSIPFNGPNSTPSTLQPLTSRIISVERVSQHPNFNQKRPGDTLSPTEHKKPRIDTPNNQTANSSSQVQDPRFERIHINVGGKIYSTTTATIKKYGNGIVTKMKLQTTYTPKGPVVTKQFMIDRDGDNFRFVLNFLRSGELILPENFVEHKLLYDDAVFYNIVPLAKIVSTIINNNAF